MASSTNRTGRKPSGSRTSKKRTNSNTRKPSSSKGRSSSNKNNKPARKDVDTGIKQEAVVFLLALAVIFIFLCMIGVVKGSFGPMIKYLILGLFGVLGYLVPLLLGLCIVFKMMNKANTVATLKLICFIVLIFMVGVILSHITGIPVKDIAKEKNIIGELYNLQTGGGVIFGLVALLLFKMLGNGGSIFFAIAILIVCIIVLTEKSLFALVSSLTERDEDDEEYYDEEEEPVRNEKPVKKKEVLKSDAAFNNYFDESSKDKKPKIREILPEKKKDELSDTAKIPELSEINSALEKEQAKRKEPSLDDVNFNPRIKKDDIHEITLRNFADEAPISAGMANLGHIDNKTLEKAGLASDNDILSASIAHAAQEDTSKAVAFSAKEASSLDKAEEDKAEEDEKVLVKEDEFDIKPISFEDKAELEEDSTVETPIPTPAPTPVPIETPGEEHDLFVDQNRLKNMVNPTTERTHAANNDKIEIYDKPVKPAPKPKKPYKKPSIELLKKGDSKAKGDSDEDLKKTGILLEDTLKVFGVDARVSDICQGPSVTRFEIELAVGVKVNKITSLAEDLKLRLAAQDIRMEAPIPGKSAVGIEIPNKVASGVAFRDLIESKKYKESTSNLTFAVGKDISGDTIVADIAKMPHMLIAGATGSGKSVCINTLIMSILYKSSPDDVKLIMIDPKVVELSVYNGIPHLMLPVVTDPRKASAALAWAVNEMTKRYKAFADFGVRDLKGFNEKAREANNPEYPYMPQIIVIVDELADLMMVAKNDVEESICRLAQLARAAGIHLIIATQRPSVDVITGLIKANMPSRVAFKVSSGVDSRTILDSVGAEKLLGKGDMLFYPQGMSKPLRVQGAFVSDGEVAGVVDYLKQNYTSDDYDKSIENEINSLAGGSGGDQGGQGTSTGDGEEFDELFEKACYLVLDKEKASSGMLQRVYKIGFNRAARIIDQMESAGIVGPEEGTKPRKVLVTEIELASILNQLNK